MGRACRQGTDGIDQALAWYLGTTAFRPLAVERWQSPTTAQVEIACSAGPRRTTAICAQRTTGVDVLLPFEIASLDASIGGKRPLVERQERAGKRGYKRRQEDLVSVRSARTPIGPFGRATRAPSTYQGLRLPREDGSVESGSAQTPVLRPRLGERVRCDR